MVIFYKKYKKYNEIQLTKNKMYLHNRKIKNHTGLAIARGNHSLGSLLPKAVDKISSQHPTLIIIHQLLPDGN